ncbi:MAG: RNase adapter RapZ [Gammaproteobacteria bacterium]|nr:RNase adapter RapZ [Gammaproteobacteria bacterium]
MPGELRLIIVSGLSGSGKSVALRVLEDLGYYCIDNLPVSLLIAAVEQFRQSNANTAKQLAVGVDARNRAQNLGALPDLLNQLRLQGIVTDIIFLHANDEILLQRYRESRRRHPLAEQGSQLRVAIAAERKILTEMQLSADLIIDTSQSSIYELAEVIRSRVDQRKIKSLSVLIESFGFKIGIPSDADFVFDLRSLPNPYWTVELRGLTGLDLEVQDFLDSQDKFAAMCEDISSFLARWIPHYIDANRGYLTVALGCTGGQHRSVHMTEKIAAALRKHHDPVLTRHNSLPAHRPHPD